MTTILTPETGEVHTLSLTASSGVDYLSEVVGNSGDTERGDDVDFIMSLDDYRWWKRWAANEQLINDTLNERGLVFEAPNFYDQYPDWDNESYDEFGNIDAEYKKLGKLQCPNPFEDDDAAGILLGWLENCREAVEIY